MPKLRFGILGGTRGMDMYHRVLYQHPYAQVCAICESYLPLMEKMKENAKTSHNGIQVFSDYDAFLDSGLDAVVIANYANDHASYAIKALQKGIHVFSEVLPTQTLQEACALCDAVEDSGKLYAYGENYCYLPTVLEMRRIFDSGMLGELMHAEANFINDCSYTWHIITRGEREHWRNYVPSTFYCTHSIGPMMFASGRRAVNVVGMETQRMPHMAQVGARSGSAAMEIMQLDNGAMGKSCNGNYRRSFASEYRFIAEHGTVENDPYNAGKLHLILAGETSAYDHRELLPVNVAKDSLGSEIYHATGRELADLERNDPFAFSDIYGINTFIQSILGNENARRHMIDVYKALDMSLPGLLAYRSILDGSAPYTVPNMRLKEDRKLWCNDTKSTDPTRSSGSDLLPSCKTGNPEVPDQIYENMNQKFRDRPVVVGSHYLANNNNPK